MGLGSEGCCGVGRCRDTLLLGAANILCGCCWSLQGYSTVRHCAGILGDWALQGFSALGHSRDTLPFNTVVRLRAEGGDN